MLLHVKTSSKVRWPGGIVLPVISCSDVNEMEKTIHWSPSKEELLPHLLFLRKEKNTIKFLLVS